MRLATREWVEKAEGDYHAARQLLRAKKHPNFDAVCFHAQQCAEKYMKAVLVENRKRIERIHDLSELLRRLSAINPFWDALREAAKALSDFAIRFRYPGSNADRRMAKSAVRGCEIIRAHMREHLRLRSTSVQSRAKRRPREKRTE